MMVMQRLCSYIWLRWLGSWLWVGCRYCVLLITGDDPAYLAANKAFLDFASANSKDVLRFAYVYQRQQQPLCQALLQNQGAHSAQVSGQNTHSPYFTKAIPKVKSSAARLKTFFSGCYYCGPPRPTLWESLLCNNHHFSVCYCYKKNKTSRTSCTFWQTTFIYPEQLAMEDLSDTMCHITDMCRLKMVQRLKLQSQCS